MSGFPEQAADRVREALPQRPLIDQRPTAAARQRIHPPLPARIAHGPAAAPQTALLETMQLELKRATPLLAKSSPAPYYLSYAVTDARADLFPLGIVLTEILLGRNIFRDVDRSQSRRCHDQRY